MRETYDVIVVGGGTAGTIAAIQSGRAGAKTLLVEKNGMLGGTLTVAGIHSPSHFFAWGRQIIAGIGWELVCRTLAEAGRDLPDLVAASQDGQPPTPSVDVALYAALCDEAVLGAGTDLLLHAMPAAIRPAGAGWEVELCLKTGLKRVGAKVLIDATGDANVVTLAGFEVDRHELVQPGTLMFGCSGYDAKALDYAALKVVAEEAVARGELLYTDVGYHRDHPYAVLHNYGCNANHLRVNACDTSEGRTRAEVDGRRALLRMVRFFRRQPGLEKFHIDWVAPECGIRETVMIRGKQTVTGADYVRGRVYEDAVCYAYYPIDIHLNDGDGVDWRPLPEGTVATVPRGALLPAGSRFLIVAGRCIAADREAQSALRVEAPCMAMGQAAGAMAALSARTGIEPADLSLGDIRALLRQHGAIVPGT
jgi:hypothetical protein